MAIIKKNILITGLPGTGKTTLIKKLFKELHGYHPVGFYTEEIREKSLRKGFILISHDGNEKILSHVDLLSRYTIGRYKVDIAGFEGFLDSISFFDPFNELVIVDEIGKMECLSKKFNSLIRKLLNSDKVVVATIALKGEGLISEIKKRDDVKLFGMTETDRDALLAELLREVRNLLWSE